jgi:hypothetical protein
MLRKPFSASVFSSIAAGGALLMIAGSAVVAQEVVISQLPGVRAVGDSTAINFPDVINDGLEDNAGVDGSAYQIPSISSSTGFGVDLGGFASVNSLRILQQTAEGTYTRRRISSATVYYQGGSQTINLPDQDDSTVSLSIPVVTPWIFVRPTGQYEPDTLTDDQVGITEMQVLSSAGTIVPRVNVAAGKASAIGGTGWVLDQAGSNGFTDNLIGSNNVVTATGSRSAFNSSGGFIDIDLGSPQAVATLGINEQLNNYTLAFDANSDLRGVDAPRQGVVTARLDFSNVADFSAILSSQVVTLDYLAYQQVDFLTATARFVRFTPLTKTTSQADANTGFSEIQLFAPVPEPGSVALLALLALPACGRRSRRRR